MSVSVAKLARTVPGADTLQESTVTGDTAYPTGGYPLTLDLFGFAVLKRVTDCRAASVAAAIWTPVPVVTRNQDNSIATLKLALVVATTGVEVANATSVATGVFNLIVEGN